MTIAPALEMLWETDDPGDALKTRFGFSDGVAAARWVVAVLDAQWGVRVDSCDRIVISGHNALAWVDTPSGRMLAKWSVAPDRFRRLAAVARLTAWLGEKGLPVSAPVVAVDGRVQVEIDGISLGLQREIDGDLLDTTDPALVRAAGAVLARLHDALATYPDADRMPELVAPSTPLADQITGWLDSRGEHIPAVSRHALRRLVADVPGDPLPTQLVHGDFRSANVLCAGSDVAAVIDFEDTRFDHRIVELARSAVMLGTRFRDWGPVSAEIRAIFLDGYQSECRLTPAEAGWWDAIVLWYTLMLTPPGDGPTGWGSDALSQLRKIGRHA
jgi:homoserine kinase type II